MKNLYRKESETPEELRITCAGYQLPNGEIYESFRALKYETVKRLYPEQTDRLYELINKTDYEIHDDLSEEFYCYDKGNYVKVDPPYIFADITIPIPI